jgi:ABC-2 type transport system ATP-binding protein
MNAISIKDLKKSYQGLEALKGISLDIKQGEFFALLGANGAGKTTAIGILTGLVNKTSGSASLFGKDVDKNYVEARELIGLVPQEFNFDIFESVYNIIFFNAGYYGIPRKDRPKKIKKILEELDLWRKKETPAMQLSGGMKRKLMIARGLIHNPKILILDEPTAGVDVETRKQIWGYMKKLNQQGTTILLTTHYIEEAEQLCEKVAIIDHGRIIKTDTTKNLLSGEHKKLEDVFLHLTKNYED